MRILLVPESQPTQGDPMTEVSSSGVLAYPRQLVQEIGSSNKSTVAEMYMPLAHSADLESSRIKLDVARDWMDFC